MGEGAHGPNLNCSLTPRVIELAMNNCFEVAVEVDAAGHADPRYSQATVYSAIWAPGPAEAEQRAKDDLVRSGYIVLALPARVQALNPFEWDRHVEAHWAGLRALLPGQAAVVAAGELPEAPPISICFYSRD